MKTANGIYLDLNESEYIKEINDFKFYFSSKFYLDKFDEMKNNYVDGNTLQINAKYDGIIDAEILLLIKLYKRIEKRGFKITFKNKDIPRKTYFKVDLIMV